MVGDRVRDGSRDDARVDHDTRVWHWRWDDVLTGSDGGKNSLVAG